MVNRVVLVGRITREPELTQTNSGVPLVRFSLAVNRSYKDANGERQADFINCIAWRSQAEFIKNYVKKGNQISVEGRIQTGSYVDSDNKTIYTTDVLVESVNNLEPRQDNQGGYTSPSNNTQVTPSSFNPPMDSEVSDDDLPF